MYHRNPAYFQPTRAHGVIGRLERQLLAERRAAADEIARLRAALQEREAALRTARAELSLAREDAVAAHKQAAARTAEVEALRARAAAVQAASTEPEALQDARRKLHRLAADLANVRRRQGEEQDRVRAEARAELLRGFVEVLDGMERALAASPDPDSPWHQGSLALKRQMMQLLTREGVERLGEVGEPFDPRLHEAVGTTPHADQPTDHIAAAVQAGYRFSDGRLIRPARVVVAQ